MENGAYHRSKGGSIDQEGKEHVSMIIHVECLYAWFFAAKKVRFSSAAIRVPFCPGGPICFFFQLLIFDAWEGSQSHIQLKEPQPPTHPPDHFSNPSVNSRNPPERFSSLECSHHKEPPFTPFFSLQDCALPTPKKKSNPFPKPISLLSPTPSPFRTRTKNTPLLLPLGQPPTHHRRPIPTATAASPNRILRSNQQQSLLRKSQFLACFRQLCVPDQCGLPFGVGAQGLWVEGEVLGWAEDFLGAGGEVGVVGGVGCFVGGGWGSWGFWG